MNNLKNTLDTFKGKNIPGFVPFVPIYHTAGSIGAKISLLDFASKPEKMAETLIWAYRNLGFDGVQLTLGVATEAEALGAKTVQSEKGLPAVTSHILEDKSAFKKLKVPDPLKDGRMPMFIEAVRITQDKIGKEAAVIATIRGPFIIAGQLRGLTPMMMDVYDDPGFLKDLIEFSSEVSFVFASETVKKTKVPIVALGEALCSPDFISPGLYREMIAPVHKKLVKRLHDAGVQIAMLHICGNILPILQAVIDTGVDAIDIDFKADLEGVLKLSKGKGLRGNLDPAWMLRAKAGEVEAQCKALLLKVKNYPWILSSGCDVPLNTPDANMLAMKKAVKSA